MTSWPKRINNVSKVIYSILNQTVKPDNVELNLSLEEFPNREDDLPDDLKIIVDNNLVNINWVEKNTKVFKKIRPTLKKYANEDFYILSIDDDGLYKNTYIETMIKQLANYDYYCLIDNEKVIGYCMIYRSTCFKNDFDDLLTEKLINLSIDDYFIEQYLLKNKKIESKNSAFKKEDFIIMFNEVFPNSGTGHYDPKRVMEAVKETNRILYAK